MIKTTTFQRNGIMLEEVILGKRHVFTDLKPETENPEKDMMKGDIVKVFDQFGEQVCILVINTVREVAWGDITPDMARMANCGTVQEFRQQNKARMALQNKGKEITDDTRLLVREFELVSIEKDTVGTPGAFFMVLGTIFGMAGLAASAWYFVGPSDDKVSTAIAGVGCFGISMYLLKTYLMRK